MRPIEIPLVLFVLTASQACVDVDESISTTGEIQQPIMNGTTYPSAVSLSAGEKLAIGFLWYDGEVVCSGTLIDSNAVLTAQHCIDNDTNDLPDRDIIDELEFRFGSPDNTLGAIEVERATVVGWEHDIALLMLDRNARAVVPSVEPIPFNRVRVDDSWADVTVEAAGFHQTHGLPHVLRFAVLTLTENWSNLIRATGYGERSVCHGDSGGPLLYETELGHPVVLAVHSTTELGCFGTSSHGLTDRVADWIDTEIAWFNSDSSGTDGVDGRYIPLVCSASPTTTTPRFWWVLVVGGALLIQRRR